MGISRKISGLSWMWDNPLVVLQSVFVTCKTCFLTVGGNERSNRRYFTAAILLLLFHRCF